MDFNKNFPDVIDLQLYENYRSTQQIVEVSNQLISKNEIRMDKSSIPKRGKGEDVTHFHCKKDKQEMQFIVDEINKIIKEKTYQVKNTDIPYSWKNIAVIVRSHRSKKPIETAFVKAGFPIPLLMV
ncbi:3'-5' exonuclease [Acinetobacter indicus]|nr:3'-5' exonuclease [Acinetobacter indicus]